jgi:hypothetical protein
MLDGHYVDKETLGYRMKLATLHGRYQAGERSTLAAEMFTLMDEIVILRDDAPASKRGKLSTLLKRFEALYAMCVD